MSGAIVFRVESLQKEQRLLHRITQITQITQITKNRRNPRNLLLFGSGLSGMSEKKSRMAGKSLDNVTPFYYAVAIINIAWTFLPDNIPATPSSSRE